MELCKKIQELRKQKGLIQEELAEILSVSRTAVSKWESGRGIPSIESLKAVAKYFSVSLDQLLSGEKIIAIAEADHNQKQGYIRDLFFGLLDIGIALLLLFLPLFGQKVDGAAQAVSLLQLTDIQPYLKTIYFMGGCPFFVSLFICFFGGIIYKNDDVFNSTMQDAAQII